MPGFNCCLGRMAVYHILVTVCLAITLWASSYFFAERYDVSLVHALQAGLLEDDTAGEADLAEMQESAMTGMRVAMYAPLLSWAFL